METPTREDLDRHRLTLTGHCYRMLGSTSDAEDAVQETMVRALRALPGFDRRSSLRTWLHRIATNACLDALGERSRRVRVFEDGPAGTIDDELVARPREHWIEPIPEARALYAEGDPAEAALARERVRLAFVAALQYLPPKQRAALLLSDVAELSATEIAECLGTSVAAVNSALQRARATLGSKAQGDAPTLPGAEAELVERYVAAFEAYDLDRLTALLHEDVIMSMPPYTLWLRGLPSVRGWLEGRGSGCRGSRLVPARASGAPAFAQYRPAPGGGHRAWSLNVLDLSAGRVARMTFFLDVERLFPAFGLPLDLR